MSIPAFLTGCLLVSWPAVAQHVTVSVRNVNGETAVLHALSGERSVFQDSLRASGAPGFTYTLGPQHPPGVYRFTFERGKWVDVVNDGEDVEITTDANAPAESLHVLRSESNRLYHAFRRLNHQYKAKSEILQLVLARYPANDPYHATSRSTALDLQNAYLEFVRSSTTERPASFVSRYIRSARLPIVDFTQPPDRQLAFLKVHALDHVDFADEGLIRSDLFTSKSIEYLMYHRNPQLPKELLAREFNGAVDSILNRAKVNAAVYKHITEYLIDGFKQFGFEECISYILDNYVIKDDLCLDGTGNTIQRMIDQKKLLPVGAVAPEVTLPDSTGRPVSLSSLAGKRKLVVFYSTTCPHCQTMLPALAGLAKAQGTALAVLAVSLDSSVEEWSRFVRLHSLPWTNVVDVQGWGGRAAGAYHIYATPTMFLLDGQGKILGKPMTVAQLQELL